MIGDVVGKPGRRVLKDSLPGLHEQHQPDLTVVNAENAAGGFGVTASVLDELLGNPQIDVLTSGNHIWDKPEALQLIDGEPRLLRPHNYPTGTPGSGARLFSSKSGKRIIVVNVMLRLFMDPLDDPFRSISLFLSGHRLGKNADAILIDVHGEATSEKQAFAHMFDGKVSAVVGSHTHVPTADGRVLANGTGFQTDAGMCGDYDSVIGGDKGAWIRRFETRMPTGRVSPPNGPGTACAVLFELDQRTGLSRSVRPVIQGPNLKPCWPK